jgi:hypothetical protein
MVYGIPDETRKEEYRQDEALDCLPRRPRPGLPGGAGEEVGREETTGIN